MHKTAGQKKTAAEKKSKKGAKSSKKHRKWGRNELKCERYRNRVGKPNGPGKPGNKSGKNKS
jgi:hypothetical protein